MKQLAWLIFLLFNLQVCSAQLNNEIHDTYGRTLILHGLNTGGDAKHNATHQPWVEEKDVDREHTQFGFNSVRYLIFWGAIEPEKGKYDEHYLAEVKKRVQWYTDRHMFVILDMHQDVFGYGVGGNGAPVWASAHTLIQNLIPDKWPWWMQNLEPKVIRSYVQFFRYKKFKERQNHYIACWQKVAQMFSGNPYVIGYDLMNEPHGGKIVKTLAGGFEHRQLSAMYKRLIPAIRQVDTSAYLFFEPRSFGVNFGMKSHLPKVNDTRPGNPRLVYAPHCYPKFVDIKGEYNDKYRKELARWYKVRLKEQKKQNTPMLLGEFGLSPTKKGYDAFLRDLNHQADSIHLSWSYWSNGLGGWSPLNNDKSPSVIMTELMRVYPSATAGTLINYNYDVVSKIFRMQFVSNNAFTQPTEIAVPKLLYSNGYKLVITGTDKYKTETDPLTGTVKVFVQNSGAMVTVSISPNNL